MFSVYLTFGLLIHMRTRRFERILPSISGLDKASDSMEGNAKAALADKANNRVEDGLFGWFGIHGKWRRQGRREKANGKGGLDIQWKLTLRAEMPL